MGLFSKTPPVQPATPSTRTIPRLWPDYYTSIHGRLVANGGNDSVQDLAYGVGNAIFNTGVQVFERTYDTSRLRDFKALYGGRTPADSQAADQMIDFLVTVDPGCQAGEGGYLGTLLRRLDDVLSRPA